jgi:predicted nucleic acid-binding protein
MVLVDSSVWIDHLRKVSRPLVAILDRTGVLCHPFVVGELACGSLARRDVVLGLMLALPQAPVAEDGEILRFLEDRRLWGRGLGWVDVHLLAAAHLASARLWTNDRRLGTCAAELGIAYET